MVLLMALLTSVWGIGSWGSVPWGAILSQSGSAVNVSITAFADITGPSTQTLSAEASISSQSTQTVSASADIQAETLQTIEGNVLVSGATPQTLSAETQITGIPEYQDIGASVDIVKLPGCSNFEGYPLGFTGPDFGSWTGAGASVQSTGGKLSGFNNYLRLGNLSYLSPKTIGGATITFNYLANPVTGGIQLELQDFDGIDAHVMLEIVGNDDGTYSLTTGGGQQTFPSQYPNQWSFFQLSFNIIPRGIADTNPPDYELWLQWYMFVNGLAQGSGLYDSGWRLSQMFSGMGINLIKFLSPVAAGSYAGITNICLTSYTPDVTFPGLYYPNPSGIIRMKVAQAIGEVGTKPSHANMRIGQAVIDLPTIPVTSHTNMRIGQAIIELLVAKTPPAPQPIPPVPTGPTGGGANPGTAVGVTCRPQPVPTIEKTVPDPPIEGIPNPPVPYGPQGRYCIPQVQGPPQNF